MEATKTRHPRLNAASRWPYGEACDQVVIARAIERARRGQTRWSKKTGSAAVGERTISDARLLYRMHGVDNALEDNRNVSDPVKRYVPKTEDGRPARAERVWVKARIVGLGGSEEVEIEADVALLDPDEHWPNEFGIALAADTEINVEELTDVLTEACMRPSYGDPDEDSTITGRQRLEEHALWIATTLLLPRTEALERQMVEAVRRHGAKLVAEGEVVTITVINHRGSNGEREVHAEIRQT